MCPQKVHACFAHFAQARRVRLAPMEALASLFEEGTPSIVPKIINGALLVRTFP